MVSSGLLRRVALTIATRRNNPEDTILQFSVYRHSEKFFNIKATQLTEVMFLKVSASTYGVMKSVHVPWHQFVSFTAQFQKPKKNF
jgi:hypothetical protein